MSKNEHTIIKPLLALNCSYDGFLIHYVSVTGLFLGAGAGIEKCMG